METALEKLHKLWDAGEHRKALHLAAGWARLGEHGLAIRGGWAAASNRHFYIEVGKDPDAMYAAGLAALAARYKLKPAQEAK